MASRPSSPVPSILAIVAISLLALPALRPMPGAVVPEGAVVKREDGFAIAPGPDWNAVPPEELRASVEKAAGRLPPNLAEALRGATANGVPALAFRRGADAGESAAPFVNVVAIPGRPRPLDDKELSIFVAAAGRRYRDLMPDFSVKSSGFATVDGMASAKMEGEGSVRTQVSKAVVTGETYETVTHTWRSHVQEAVFRDDAFTVIQYLVPGGEHGYVVTFTIPRGTLRDVDSEVKRVVDSFRVLDRPPRHGYAMRGAAVGALIGAGLGLLLILARSFLQRSGAGAKG